MINNSRGIIINKLAENIQIDKVNTFAGIVGKYLNEFYSANNREDTEPLANIDYENELEIKNKSLQEFWKVKKLPGNLSKIKSSPKSRMYRSTSKRRVVSVKSKFYLLFSKENRLPEKEYYLPSLLEPDEHNCLYNFLSKKINEPEYRFIGNNLNYIIIRGNYTEFTVIFNVHTLNAAVVRKFKLLADYLQNIKEAKVISAFIYLDPTQSEYYLENDRPMNVVNFKKLFGPDKIFFKLDNFKFSYHPTSFSQINQSIIPALINEVRRILIPDKSARLIDLYCGYGLFSLYFADYFREVIGIEAEGESVKSAILNSTFYKGRTKIKFVPKRINGSNLIDVLPEQKNLDEYFILDPPRQGIAEGVIKSISSRKPKKVLHIFCGIERIQSEIKEWEKHRYKVKEVVPLDLFPGTPNLEILFLLESTEGNMYKQVRLDHNRK